MEMVFEWDTRKAQSNARKHGVTFAEALSVFSDPLAQIFPGEEHSADETREIVVGHSTTGALLLVCFTERPKRRVRIFSARRATRPEQQDYEENAEI
jgi:hypothetical protein